MFDDFYKRYEDQIAGIGKANNVDTDTARTMFLSNIKNSNNPNATIYAGGGVLDMNKPSMEYNALANQVLAKPTTQTIPTLRNNNTPVENTKSFNDYVGIARDVTSPEYEKVKNNLKLAILGTREQLPQQLNARGQAVGGLRTLQENELTKEEALQLANIEADRLAATNSLALELQNQDLAKLEADKNYNLQLGQLTGNINGEKTLPYLQYQSNLTQQGYENEQAEKMYNDEMAQQGFENNLTTDKWNFTKEQYYDSQAKANQPEIKTEADIYAYMTPEQSQAYNKYANMLSDPSQALNFFQTNASAITAQVGQEAFNLLYSKAQNAVEILNQSTDVTQPQNFDDYLALEKFNQSQQPEQATINDVSKAKEFIDINYDIYDTVETPKGILGKEQSQVINTEKVINVLNNLYANGIITEPVLNALLDAYGI